MKTTTNLGLKKPEGTDIVNIDDINYNADIMDAEIGNIKKGVVKVGVSASSDTAAKLQTPRAISLNGDLIGNANFDGSANTCINARLQNSGVTAGSYTKVSVDEKGRVVAGSNPMTLAGYGITDALPASSYTAADVLNKLKTVHGEGSGLNADLLDGKDSTAFATAAQGAKADTAVQTSQLDKPGGAVSYDVFKSHLTENAKVIGTTALPTTAKDLTGAIKELFQNADNGQKSIANVVGSPTVAGDTYAKISSNIQNLKNGLATNLTNKGQSSSGTDTLNNLIWKVANINTGKRSAKGFIKFDRYDTIVNKIDNLNFTPFIVYFQVYWSPDRYAIGVITTYGSIIEYRNWGSSGYTHGYTGDGAGHIFTNGFSIRISEGVASENDSIWIAYE